MTLTEKLLSHLQNILPRRDWELHREAITKMIEAIRDQSVCDGLRIELTKPTEAKS